MVDLPYAAASAEKLNEIIRLAETRLSAQLTVAIAADQRAMTFASFLAAVEGASIAGLVALRADPVTHWSLVMMVFGFAISAVFALMAAQPVEWDMPGGRPGDWLDDIDEGDSLHNGRAAFAAYYDEMLVDNAAVVASNALLLNNAMVGVIFTLCLAGLLAILFG